MGKTFRACILSIAPTKKAKCINKEFITNCQEDTSAGSLTFESDFSLREIKLKLGITNNSDIIEDQNSLAIKSDSEDQSEKPEEIEQASNHKIEGDHKMGSNPPSNNPIQPGNPSNQPYTQKLKVEIPELSGTSFEEIQTYCEDVKTFKKLMKNQWTDEEIIFSSLVKSKKNRA